MGTSMAYLHILLLLLQKSIWTTIISEIPNLKDYKILLLQMFSITEYYYLLFQNTHYLVILANRLYTYFEMFKCFRFKMNGEKD